MKTIPVSLQHQIKRRPAGHGLSFWLMFPIIITRSIMEIGNNKLSVVFTAKFSDGSEKMLRDVRANRGIVLQDEIGISNECLISKDDSPLYTLDWSNNPVFGTFKKNYPKSVN